MYVQSDHIEMTFLFHFFFHKQALTFFVLFGLPYSPLFSLQLQTKKKKSNLKLFTFTLEVSQANAKPFNNIPSLFFSNIL